LSKKENKNVEDTPHLESTSVDKKIDIHSTESSHKGLAGLFESTLRRFKFIGFVCAMIPIPIAYVVAFGVALTPGYIFTTSVFHATAEMNFVLHAFCMGMILGISYITYGFSLIIVAPLLSKLMPRVKAWRGNWYSMQVIPWYYHNALVQLVRYTFLDFVTPTPINIFFYRAMGMKIGKNCIINTSNISDPFMIELEDNVTIGGSVTIFGHYAQSGFMIFAPVLIKKGATIGLKASIMGDVVIGEKVVVKPHEVILPKTRIPNKVKGSLS
jgi:hypothetical protein